MDEEELDDDLKAAIIDRYFGWELVEFLNISIEDVVEAFEENILDKLEDIKEDIEYDDGYEHED